MRDNIRDYYYYSIIKYINWEVLLQYVAVK
jgi:hypothetical protein